MVGLLVPLNSKRPSLSALGHQLTSAPRLEWACGRSYGTFPKGQVKVSSKWSHQPCTAAEASPGPAAPPGCVVSQPQAGVCLQRRGDEALCGLSQDQVGGE